MALPKITYGTGYATTLEFKRGPVNFCPYYAPRVHDNLSSSGAARERVSENKDMLIGFDMPHMILGDDLEGWSVWAAAALDGAEFRFYPNASLPDYYNCVLEDQAWQPTRNAPKKYGASIVLRVLQDEKAPASTAIVLQRFHGVAAPQ